MADLHALAVRICNVLDTWLRADDERSMQQVVEPLLREAFAAQQQCEVEFASIQKSAKVLKLEDVIQRTKESETVTLLRLYEVICTLRIETAKAMAECDAARQERDEALGQLGECYELTGADPDGNERWRNAPYAVEEVRRLRQEHDAIRAYGGDELATWEKERARAEAAEAKLAQIEQFHERLTTRGHDGAGPIIAELGTILYP